MAMLHLRTRLVAVSTMLVLFLANALPAAAEPADSAPNAVVAAIFAQINQLRAAHGLVPLIDDPRLDQAAEARAHYMVANAIWGHCLGNEANDSCPTTGYAFPGQALQQGIDVRLPGTQWGENLALNNHETDIASKTVADWMASPAHRSNILNGTLLYTGLAVLCCFSGTAQGIAITPDDDASVFVQEFTGGVGADPGNSVATTFGAEQTGCTYSLGFAQLAAELGPIVGQCVTNAASNPLSGNALQTTAHGVLIWRKADNWTAFTDGYHTWITTLSGVAQRFNNERFSWERNLYQYAKIPTAPGSATALCFDGTARIALQVGVTCSSHGGIRAWWRYPAT